MIIKRIWESPPKTEAFEFADEIGDDLVVGICDRQNVQSVVIMFTDGSSVLYEVQDAEEATTPQQ
jgi:hypothetical protein